MRIRTDGEYEWRAAEIQALADFYGVNKTEAVLQACEDVPALAKAVADVLERDDLTVRQRREIADRFARVHNLEVELDEDVSVGPG